MERANPSSEGCRWRLRMGWKALSLAVDHCQRNHRRPLVRSKVLRNMTSRVLPMCDYARKSTDEGLEQDFNSLDVQRKSCATYILSQAGLGWRVLTKHFDDGGISGGTMERPAL